MTRVKRLSVLLICSMISVFLFPKANDAWAGPRSACRNADYAFLDPVRMCHFFEEHGLNSGNYPSFSERCPEKLG